MQKKWKYKFLSLLSTIATTTTLIAAACSPKQQVSSSENVVDKEAENKENEIKIQNQRIETLQKVHNYAFNLVIPQIITQVTKSANDLLNNKDKQKQFTENPELKNQITQLTKYDDLLNGFNDINKKLLEANFYQHKPYYNFTAKITNIGRIIFQNRIYIISQILQTNHEDAEKITDYVKKYSEIYALLNFTARLYWSESVLNVLSNVKQIDQNKITDIQKESINFQSQIDDILKQIQETNYLENKEIITKVEDLTKKLNDTFLKLNEFWKTYLQLEHKKQIWSFAIGKYKDTKLEIENQIIDNYEPLSSYIDKLSKNKDKDEKEKNANETRIQQLKNLQEKLLKEGNTPETDVRNDVDYQFFLPVNATFKYRDNQYPANLFLTVYSKDNTGKFRLNDFDLDDNTTNLSTLIPDDVKHFAKLTLSHNDFVNLYASYFNVREMFLNPEDEQALQPYKLALINLFTVNSVNYDKADNVLKLGLLNEFDNGNYNYNADSFEGSIPGLFSNFALFFNKDSFIEDSNVDLFFQISDDLYNYLDALNKKQNANKQPNESELKENIFKIEIQYQ
ncbi:hypothetical protein ACXYRR_01155 [Mycoplasma sp. 246B]